LAKVSE
jgi:hypothetical protein